jgi:hypothetical protein
MGDRGQVNIKNENVWLYTHWGASDLVDTVKSAMRKRWRWGDPEYLARIIFCEMVKGDEGSENGFGISSTGPHGDEWRIITVDCENRLVSISDDGETQITKSFKEFII